MPATINQPVDVRLVVRQLEAAMENTCAALVALQALAAGPVAPVEEMCTQLRASLHAVHAVIAALHAVAGVPESGLAAGFVVARRG